MDELLGLPAHPLIVHAVVVLLPLAAVATLVVAAVPRRRRPYALLAFGTALVATGAVWMAQEAGEKLEERVGESDLVERHADLAGQVLPWAIALLVVSGAVVAVDRFGARAAAVSATWVTVVLLVAAGITAAGSTVTVVRAGHSGSTAVWNGLPASDDDDNSGRGGGDDGGGDEDDNDDDNSGPGGGG